jgi:hypothetical protein
MRWRDCPECGQGVTPNVLGACASVGIEEKMSTVEMLDIYMAGEHKDRGHDALYETTEQ